MPLLSVVFRISLLQGVEEAGHLPAVIRGVPALRPRDQEIVGRVDSDPALPARHDEVVLDPDLLSPGDALDDVEHDLHPDLVQHLLEHLGLLDVLLAVVGRQPDGEGKGDARFLDELLGLVEVELIERQARVVASRTRDEFVR